MQSTIFWSMAALTPPLPRISYHSVYVWRYISSHAWHMCTQFSEQEFIGSLKQNCFISLHMQASILQWYVLHLLINPLKWDLLNSYGFIHIFYFFLSFFLSLFKGGWSKKQKKKKKWNHQENPKQIKCKHRVTSTLRPRLVMDETTSIWWN